MSKIIWPFFSPGCFKCLCSAVIPVQSGGYTEGDIGETHCGLASPLRVCRCSRVRGGPTADQLMPKGLRAAWSKKRNKWKINKYSFLCMSGKTSQVRLPWLASQSTVLEMWITQHTGTGSADEMKIYAAVLTQNASSVSSDGNWTHQYDVDAGAGY